MADAAEEIVKVKTIRERLNGKLAIIVALVSGLASGGGLAAMQPVNKELIEYKLEQMGKSIEHMREEMKDLRALIERVLPPER